jgi:tRNA uridine 5-carboxymethylaminomethyl modification enzyme
MMDKYYGVIVVGAGHAGVEAALASARMGVETLMIAIDNDSVGWMPCNPAIGGPGKSQVVREIDALGGVMAMTTDATLTQIKTLNTSRGPAV